MPDSESERISIPDFLLFVKSILLISTKKYFAKISKIRNAPKRSLGARLIIGDHESPEQEISLRNPGIRQSSVPPVSTVLLPEWRIPVPANSDDTTPIRMNGDEPNKGTQE